MTELRRILRLFSINGRILPWTVLFAGLLITTGLFLEGRQTALDDFGGRFEEHAIVRAYSMVREMDEAMLAIRDIGQFCQKEREVKSRFSAFAGPLLKHHSQLDAVGWIPKVAGTSGRFSYPILCSQSSSGERDPVALDFGSDPVLLSLLERARDSGEPVAVDNRPRITGMGNPSDLLVVQPIYGRRHISGVADRKEALQGFVLSALKTGEILSTYINPAAPEVCNIELLDLSPGQGERPIHQWPAPSRAGSRSLLKSFLIPPYPPYLLRFFSGKEWGIRVLPSRVYMENNYDCSYWFLLPAGVTVALALWFVTLYMKTILSQGERTKRLLSERTAELHEHDQYLGRLVEERTESLSRMTSFLEALADTSAEGILVVDGQGRMLFRNKRYAELWRAPHDLLDGNDEEAWNRHVLAMVKDPGLFRMGEERLFAHPDETFCDEVDLIDERVLERHSCPLVGDDRGPHERVFRFREITERKRAEEALRESENTFRDLAEKSIVGIYLIQDGMFRYVNSRFAEIHGYTPQELIDRKSIEETAVREDVAGVQENIRKRIAGELDLVRGEFRIVTKRGETKDVEIYGSHTVYRGRKAVIGTLLDVTERKRTESMLRWKTAFLEAQVNSSLDGILAIDNEGRHILQNQRTADIWKVPHHILGDRDDSRRFDYMVRMTKHEGQFRQKLDYLMGHPNETSRDEIELRNGYGPGHVFLSGLRRGRKKLRAHMDLP